MYRKSLLYTLMLTYPAGGLKVGLGLHPYFVCASSGETLKIPKFYWIRGDKLACVTDK